MNINSFSNKPSNISFYKSLLSLFFLGATMVFGIAQDASYDNDLSAAYAEANVQEESTKEVSQQSSSSFALASRTPFFSGGHEALQDYFTSEITYTENAKKYGKEGIVKVQVLVNPNGELTDPKVIGSVDKALETQILEAVQDIPNWEPALQNGRAVKCKVIIPIKLRLR